MKRIISLLILNFFVFNMVSGAYAGEVNNDTQINPKEQLFVPQSIGYIADQYLGNPDKPHIIVIQDLHCHFSTQVSIYKLLRYIKKYYKDQFSYIGVEGSSGFIDTSIISDIPNAMIKKEITINLMKKGLINGVEAYDVLNPKKIKIFGLEDKTLHEKNLKQLCDALFEDKDWDTYILDIKNFINKKKKKFNKNLKKILKYETKYSNGNIGLDKLLEEISGLEKKSSLLKYPLLDEYYKISKLKKVVYLPAVQSEAKFVLDKMKNMLTKEEQNSILELKKLNDLEFYLYVYHLVKIKNIRAEKASPNFIKYAEYINREDSIDKVLLEEELYEYLAFAKESFSKNKLERDMVNLEKYILLIEDYVTNNISATKKELLEKNRKTITYLMDKYTENAEVIDKKLNEMTDFYNTAIKRNEVLANNTMACKGKVIAIVVGGFHYKGITEYLRAKGYGYTAYIPNIGIADKANYMRRLKEYYSSENSKNTNSKNNTGLKSIAFKTIFNTGTEIENIQALRLMQNFGILEDAELKEIFIEASKKNKCEELIADNKRVLKNPDVEIRSSKNIMSISGENLRNVLGFVNTILFTKYCSAAKSKFVFIKRNNKYEIRILLDDNQTWDNFWIEYNKREEFIEQVNKKLKENEKERKLKEQKIDWESTELYKALQKELGEKITLTIDVSANDYIKLDKDTKEMHISGSLMIKINNSILFQYCGKKKLRQFVQTNILKNNNGVIEIKDVEQLLRDLYAADIYASLNTVDYMRNVSSVLLKKERPDALQKILVYAKKNPKITNEDKMIMVSFLYNHLVKNVLNIENDKDKKLYFSNMVSSYLNNSVAFIPNDIFPYIQLIGDIIKINTKNSKEAGEFLEELNKYLHVEHTNISQERKQQIKKKICAVLVLNKIKMTWQNYNSNENMTERVIDRLYEHLPEIFVVDFNVKSKKEKKQTSKGWHFDRRTILPLVYLAGVIFLPGIAGAYRLFSSDESLDLKLTKPEKVEKDFSQKPKLEKNVGYDDNSTLPVEDMFKFLGNSEYANTRLVRSYPTGDASLVKYGFTYDQAVTAIAYTYNGNYTGASNILNFFVRTINKDTSGYYYSAYDVRNGAVAEWNMHTGFNSWLGIASVQFYDKTGNNTFIEKLAKPIAQALMNLQDASGCIKGGPIDSWVSTEHNFDAYTLFNMLYKVTGNTQYNIAAQKVKAWLLTQYKTNECYFNRGLNDGVFATDITSMAVFAFGKEELESNGVNVTCLIDQTINQALTNVKFNGHNVTGFDFGNAVSLGRDSMISSELSAQICQAIKETQHIYGYGNCMNNLIGLLENSTIGGIGLPYATSKKTPTGHGWDTPDTLDPALAGTAWAILADMKINPFQLSGNYPLTYPTTTSNTRTTTLTSATTESSQASTTRGPDVTTLVTTTHTNLPSSTVPVSDNSAIGIGVGITSLGVLGGVGALIGIFWKKIKSAFYKRTTNKTPMKIITDVEYEKLGSPFLELCSRHNINILGNKQLEQAK
jgi:hypothetical protein